MPDGIPESLRDYVDRHEHGLILHLPRRTFLTRALLWLIIPLPLWGFVAFTVWIMQWTEKPGLLTPLMALVGLGTAVSWLVGIASLLLSKKLVAATRIGIDVKTRQILFSTGQPNLPFADVTAIVVERTEPDGGPWRLSARMKGDSRVLLPQIPAREGAAAAELGAACADLAGAPLELPDELERGAAPQE